MEGSKDSIGFKIWPKWKNAKTQAYKSFPRKLKEDQTIKN